MARRDVSLVFYDAKNFIDGSPQTRTSCIELDEEQYREVTNGRCIIKGYQIIEERMIVSTEKNPVYELVIASTKLKKMIQNA